MPFTSQSLVGWLPYAIWAFHITHQLVTCRPVNTGIQVGDWLSLAIILHSSVRFEVNWLMLTGIQGLGFTLFPSHQVGSPMALLDYSHSSNNLLTNISVTIRSLCSKMVSICHTPPKACQESPPWGSLKGSKGLNLGVLSLMSLFRMLK